MPTLRELLAQRDALELEIADQRAAGRARAIAKIHVLLVAHGLTVADLQAIPSKRARGGSPLAGKRVAPKYRDPATGATWAGRGMQPRWVATALAQGKSLR